MTTDTPVDELVSWLTSFSPTALREGERAKCVEAADRIVSLSLRVRELEGALEYYAGIGNAVKTLWDGGERARTTLSDHSGGNNG